jgi:hypothetical protein
MKKYLKLFMEKITPLKEEVPMPTAGEYLPNTSRSIQTGRSLSDGGAIVTSDKRMILIIAKKAQNLFHSIDPHSTSYHREVSTIFNKMGESFDQVASREDSILLQQYWNKVHDCIYIRKCPPSTMIKLIDDAVGTISQHFRS